MKLTKRWGIIAGALFVVNLAFLVALFVSPQIADRFLDSLNSFGVILTLIYSAPMVLFASIFTGNITVSLQVIAGALWLLAVPALWATIGEGIGMIVHRVRMRASLHPERK